MKKLDIRDFRGAMYGQANRRSTKTEKDKSFEIINRDVIVLNEGGKKTTIPTADAFSRLLTEHQNLNREFRNAQSQIKTLTDGINVLIREVNRLSSELDQKVDKLHED